MSVLWHWKRQSFLVPESGSASSRKDNRDPSERPLSAFQSGIVSAGASDESGDLPSDRTECCQICKGGEQVVPIHVQMIRCPDQNIR